MPHCPVTVVQRYRDVVCSLLFHLFFIICHPYIPLHLEEMIFYTCNIVAPTRRMLAHKPLITPHLAPVAHPSGSSKPNRVGLQAHRGILLCSLYLQVVVEVCHQLLVSSLADIPAVGSENWQQKSPFPV